MSKNYSKVNPKIGVTAGLNVKETGIVLNIHNPDGTLVIQTLPTEAQEDAFTKEVLELLTIRGPLDARFARALLAAALDNLEEVVVGAVQAHHQMVHEGRFEGYNEDILCLGARHYLNFTVEPEEEQETDAEPTVH